MEKFVKKGAIKGLGLCNFNIAQVEDVLKHCEIKPVAHQIEVHPYFQNDKLINFCHNNNIKIIAYSPL
jgi:diketogulonate reductase-like aldo/keto reductase